MTLELRDLTSGWLHLYETHCKRWTCPSCGPQKTSALCRRIETAKPQRFITLTTARHAARNPRQVYDETRRQIPELIRELRKEKGEIEYCRVLETTKTGYPHYHLLVRSPWIDQEHLSKSWARLSTAFIVDIRRIDQRKEIASYVAKYLAKQTVLPFTNRRVTQSRRFFPPPPPKPESTSNWTDARRHIGSIQRVCDREFPGRTWSEVHPYHRILDPLAIFKP